MSREAQYLLDNQQTEAGTRFNALSTLFDAWTFRHFEDIGVSGGWRCWEVGSGGSSVPRWLAERVGLSGRVLATDIDVSWMRDISEGQVEVRRHDAALDEAPAETFDVVHARLVLVHLVNRAAALRSMVSVLRPGGYMFLEDADPALQPLICPDEYGPEQRLANKLRRGFRTLLSQRGADLAYGRTLPRLLRDAGMADVVADAFFPMTSAACNLLEKATVEQVGEHLIAGGLSTAEEIDRHLANVSAGVLDLATSPMVSAWGRKPMHA
jgi:SAM-dependent methyltransferase